MAALEKGARITGTARTKLANDLKKAYNKGESIRDLAREHGRSYGFIHRVLSEADVSLRGRGGATRGVAAKTSTAKASTSKASTSRAKAPAKAKATAKKAATKARARAK